MLFTDEFRFCRFSNDRRYAQCNIAQTVSYGGRSVKVWGGLYLEGRAELVIVN
jgi:hypothetical protein